MTTLKELFGKKIKELRIKHGLSQEELSEKIGIAERNLSKIECGKCFIRAEKIEKLCEILNVKPRDLFDFEYHKSIDLIRDELIKEIKEDDKNLKLLYKLYSAIK